LLGLRERASLLGGEVTITSACQGTHVEVSFP
jgi:signal transduction histidine kinase